MSKYGHSGQLPDKEKKVDLQMRYRKQKKRIEDGRPDKKKESGDSESDVPLLTKKEIQMSQEDMKYMSSKNQLKRFSQYLNHSFFLGADAFLRTKHS